MLTSGPMEQEDADPAAVAVPPTKMLFARSVREPVRLSAIEESRRFRRSSDRPDIQVAAGELEIHRALADRDRSGGGI